MEQEKLAALVKLIMADKRIMDMIRTVSRDGTSQDCGLTLIETQDLYDCLPLEWRGNVYCQEAQEGADGLMNYDAAYHGTWKQIRIYQPSWNVIAKLALGIADEAILRFVQDRLMEGYEEIELTHLCHLTKVKSDTYRKLFAGYLDKIKSFGIKINDVGAQETAHAGIWQYKALTERDLRDMEKGTVLTVGRKCIVTSLAVDMARRKSIRICREGDVI